MANDNLEREQWQLIAVSNAPIETVRHARYKGETLILLADDIEDKLAKRNEDGGSDDENTI